MSQTAAVKHIILSNQILSDFAPSLTWADEKQWQNELRWQISKLN